jgi:transposase-like protein
MAKAKPKDSMNLMRLMDAYDTDKECRDALEALRWPEGVRCPRCDADKVYRAEPRKQFDCALCGYQFSVTSGTIFNDSHLPLPSWFVATYLICESKKGISANQIKRTLGVSYKTAWYLCHRIRAAMKDATPEMLRGIIEFDETYVGGKVRGRGAGFVKNKAIVVGAVERGGDIRIRVIKRRNKRAIQQFVKSVAHEDAEGFMTDEAYVYIGIGDADTPHETVRHKDEEWVRGDVHTNTVEGVWSLLKRSIVGSYHQLSAKHLPAYLDEISFRYNNRENAYLFRDTLTALINAEPMPYKDLIKDKASLSTQYRRKRKAKVTKQQPDDRS